MVRVFEILIILCIIAFLFIWVCESYFKESFETLEQDSFYKSANKYEEIYDNFFGFLYDDLFYQEEYYASLCEVFLQYMNTVYNKKLCIGIKHGGHVNELLKKNMDTLSISRSNAIVNICQYHYPKHKYKYIPNIETNAYIFNENEFTHISLIDNELYYLSNLSGFMYNCSRWLIFKGYLFIQCYYNISQLKKSFVKIGENSSTRMKTVYSHEFKDFQESDSFYFIEKLKYREKERNNKHTLFFYKKDYIDITAQEYGMYLTDTLPLSQNECVLVFQKR